MGDKTKDFPLFREDSTFTDDSVMTIAVADALLSDARDPERIKTLLVYSMKRWGKKLPDVGYGGMFYRWLFTDDSQPYGSFGNGSAMRVASAGWLYDTLEETREKARLTAEVMHNHPEGIKGAESVASVIWLARNGKSKQEIREYVIREFGYDLSRTCDEIRPGYYHVESCQQTVPEAITAFLEGESFEDVIRTAVSLGGDCDTLTCIAGSMAEAFYGVPEELKEECRKRITPEMKEVLDRFDNRGKTMDKEKLIEELREAKALPDLSGLEIIWLNMGLVPGDAEAQEELPQIMIAWLKDFYRDLLVDGCGADRVAFYDPPKVGGFKALKEDLPHKTPVDVYHEASELPMLSEDEKNKTTVSINESQVSFRPNTADFVQSDEEVYASLEGLIDSLRESENFHVVIAGGTSSFGQQASSEALSRDRAGRIRDFLVKNGVQEEQIEGVYGLGFREDSPIYTNDRVNGELVESLAAANRIVVVAGISSDLAKKIVAAGEKNTY